MYYFWLHDWVEHRDLQNLRYEAKLASSRARVGMKAQSKSNKRIDEIEMRLEESLLMNQALWNLLSEKLGVTEDELKKKINELDLADGILDGRLRKPNVICPKCNGEVSQRFKNCIHCGTEL